MQSSGPFLMLFETKLKVVFKGKTRERIGGWLIPNEIIFIVFALKLEANLRQTQIQQFDQLRIN